MPDVVAALDSMAVGSVKPTYYNAQDNTINTIKLIGKEEAPDSILYRQIASTKADPAERKAQADSILKALNAGASFAELAKNMVSPLTLFGFLLTSTNHSACRKKAPLT